MEARTEGKCPEGGSRTVTLRSQGLCSLAQVLAEVERAGLGQGQLPGTSSLLLSLGSGFLHFRIHIRSPIGRAFHVEHGAGVEILK